MAAVVAVAVLGACGSGARSVSDARVVSFTVPKAIDCPTPPATEFQFHYELEKAKSFVVAVDGRTVPGLTKPSGTVTAPVHCDAVPHDVVIRAVDAKNRPVTARHIMRTIYEQPTG